MKKTIFSFLFVLTASFLFAQNKFTLSCYVTDASTGETLIGANVYDEASQQGGSTNLYGFYAIVLPEGKHRVVASFIGYESYEYEVELKSNTRLDIELKPISKTLETIEIKADRKKNIEGTQMGTVNMEVEKIKTLPAFLGEVDIIKTIQLLPGVQSGGEGNSGLYVRGGGPDQNLILLDGAVVYNVSHLFGFFSVFNADAVKNIELIKGGIPANYGGRLSSVLDISMNDGNKKEFSGSGGIGLISSRLTLEGPVQKGKSSFIVSGRRTYIDVLLAPLAANNPDFDGTGYFFYDLNAKFNHTFSDKDKVFVSGYFGRDRFSFRDPAADFSINVPWGNATTSARWNHIFGQKLFMNTTGTFSDYDFSFRGEQEQFVFNLFSGVRDLTLKTDLTWYPSPRHNVKFGAGHIYHTFRPNNLEASSGDTDFITGEKEKIHANESHIYILDEYAVNDQLKINAGLRLSNFAHIGPFKRFLKDPNNENITTRETIDIIDYARGDQIQSYLRLEPRLSMRYKLNANSSVKAAVTRNVQFIHLASLSPIALPTDLWLPSTDQIKPQDGYQFNAGYFRDFADNTFNASVEVFYKSMDNLVAYGDGVNPEDIINDNVDNFLVFGDGYAFGAELFINKKIGRTSGWIGYTWSKTERRFEAILDGEYFPARYDRRHDLSIVASHKLNDKWTFGLTWVYGTGDAISLAESWYLLPQEGVFAFEYGDRNSQRMRAFHRFDASATLYVSPNKFKKDPSTGEEIEVPRKWETNWNFSIYNAYNRANPYILYYDIFADPGNEQANIKVKQLSLFPILPSVTWNFKF
ncbi:MAG: TonB-dependent receptor [Bacteroidota bacterium]